MQTKDLTRYRVLVGSVDLEAYAASWDVAEVSHLEDAEDGPRVWAVLNGRLVCVNDYAYRHLLLDLDDDDADMTAEVAAFVDHLDRCAFAFGRMYLSKHELLRRFGQRMVKQAEESLAESSD